MDVSTHQEYRLSRLDLIGDNITETTPNLVIYEIANSHGIPTDLS